MSVQTFVPDNQIVTMSPSAQRYFAQKLAEQSASKLIRFATKVSGCTGFAYVLDFAEAAQPDDIIIEINDAITLAVDSKALNALRHTEIDYVKEGINGVVKFNNPNVLDQCGCGESFNVK